MGAEAWGGLLNGLDAPAVVIDDRGVIAAANGAAERQFGPAAAAGSPFAGLADEDDRPRLAEYVRLGAAIAPVPLLGTDGERRAFAMRFERLTGPGNGFTGWLLMLRDTSRTDATPGTGVRYRSLMEQAADGIYLSDVHGRYLDVNPRGCEMLGYTREEMLKLGVADIAAPGAFDRRLPELMEGQVIVTERLLRRKDGSLFYADVSSKALVDGTLQDIVRDVTDRRRAEDARRESEERFRAAFAHANTGMCLTGLDGRLFQVNSALAGILGYPEQELIGKSFREFTHPDDIAVSNQAVQDMVTGRQPSIEFEKRYLRKDGRTVLALVNATVVRDAQGRPLYFVTQIQDISERRRADEELRRAHDDLEKRVAERSSLLAGITEAAVDGVLVVSDEGKMLSFNRRFVEMWRIPPDIVASRSDDAALASVLGSLVDPDGFLARVRRLYAHPDEESRDEIALRDGRTFDRHSAPVRGPDGARHGRVWFFRDVSDRRRAEARLQRQHAALIEITRSPQFKSADIGSALRLITEGVARTLGVERVGIWQYSDDRRALRCLDQFELGAGRHTSGVELNATQYPSYFRAMTGSDVVAADDAETDPRTSEFRDGYLRPLGITSMMDAPIHLHGALAGVLCQEHVGPARRWTPDEQLFATAAANLTSLVLDRWARLRLEQRLATQNATTLVLADAKTEEEAVPRLLKTIGQNLGWPLAALWTVDPAAEVIRFAGYWSDPSLDASGFAAASRGNACAPGTGLMGRVWQNAAPVWIPDAPADSSFGRAPAVSRAGLHTALGFPILVGREPWGAIELYAPDVRPLDTDLLKLTAALGSQIGQFIERRRAEDALRATEEKFRVIVENSIDPIFIKDTEGRYRLINPAGARVFGRSAADVLGLSDVDLLGEGGREIMNADREVISSGQVKTYETTRTFPVGERVFMSTKFPYLSPDGRIIGLIGISRDITERKRAEEALRASEEKFRAVAETANDAIVSGDRAGCVIHFNRGAERIFGYAAAEVAGRPLTMFMPERYHAAHREGLARYLSTGVGKVIGRPVELSGLRKDGSEVPLEVSLAAWKSGGETFFTGILRDITERKRAEEALRESERRYSELIQESPDPIISFDPLGHIRTYNPAAQRLAGYKPEEVLGRHFVELGMLSDASVARTIEEFRLVMAGEDRRPFEVEIRSKDRRALTFEANPRRLQRGGAVAGVQVIFRDVTERKRAEEEVRRAAAETRRAYQGLKRAQQRVIRAEKMASAGMVMAGIAHEINNPLNVVYGNLRLLRDKLGRAGPGVPQMLGDALTGAENARRVVEEFRNFARERGEAELSELAECVNEAVARVRSMAGDRVTLEVTVGRLPKLQLFRAQIVRALANLLKNAIEAIDGRGTVRVSLAKRGSQAVIEVADTGRGIQRPHLSKVFEPFFSTKEHGKGFGLGLALTLAIIQNHGGEIKVRSRVGRGTTFTLALPIQRK